MKTHKDLEVWTMSIKLAGHIYQLTENYPKKEVFGITSQMRRAAVSIGANIAEGAARRTNKEFMQFLYIALGSASELDALIEISRETKLNETEKLAELQLTTTKISKMLSGLINNLKSR